MLRCPDAFGQDDKGLDDHAPGFIRDADDAAFADGRVRQQGRLDFRPRDVVTGGDDHVVSASLVPDIPVLVHGAHVAGGVPAVHHVIFLALIGQILAPGRAFQRQAAQSPRRRRLVVITQDAGPVARYCLAGGAGADLIARRGNEYVDHFGRTEDIDHPDPGCRQPLLVSGQGQFLTRAGGFLQAAEVKLIDVVQDGAIGGRRGGADGRPELADGPCKFQRRGRLHQRNAGPGVQGHAHQHAETEGERDRRAADNDVGRFRPDHILVATDAHGHDVALEMDRALGLAGGAAGESDDCRIVRGSIDGLERGRFCGHEPLQFRARAGLSRTVELHDPLHDAGAFQGAGQFLHEAFIAQREPDLRLVDDRFQFQFAQQRHGGDRHPAGFYHAEPAGDQHRVVGRAQQDPVARRQAQVIYQYVGDAVGLLIQVLVAPGLVARQYRIIGAVPLADLFIEQLRRAVQARRELQFVGGEQELGQQLRRRQVVPDESIDVAGRIIHVSFSSGDLHNSPIHIINL